MRKDQGLRLPATEVGHSLRTQIFPQRMETLPARCFSWPLWTRRLLMTAGRRGMVAAPPPLSFAWHASNARGGR